MRRQLAVIAGMFALLAVIVAGLMAWGPGSDDAPAEVALDSAEGTSTLVRDDSRVVGEPGSSGVTFVEFLDFECEACGAAYPIVEDLRENYEGEVTFVSRYFPLDGHFNAERAARAVESAARQDKFVEMYQMMYETQSAWGEGREPLDDLFRSYAEDLGLDMATYDADYASEEVAARVEADRQDGLSLGVQGTPTFFVDGKRFEPESIDDFDAALDEALAGASS